jgi:anti-sigma regulatory factor (Ser/Thr protein kinase)
MKRFEIQIPSDPSCLRIVRASVAVLCELGGMDEDEKCQVVLAVDEACSNIIRHSYGGADGQPIICEGKIDGDYLAITLQDFGKKVDPSSIQPRELAEVRPGGLGVHFIREVMDEVEFGSHGEDGTRLCLRKRLSTPERQI